MKVAFITSCSGGIQRLRQRWSLEGPWGHVSHSPNSFKGAYMGDYIGDCFRGY